ncbi:MAG TPA: DUF1329 domain-containing protein [Candidatus Kryptonia bacterium]|nr:DUF1329 domain-containing protein [Candidatus Kryptonia bacterium]
MDRRVVARVLAACVSLCVLVGQVAADVKPGDVISASNVDQAKDLISPGLEWVIRHGMKMRIVEPRKVDWPRAYKEATEKYSGQVRLSADGLKLENYVGGLPFPSIDLNDPKAALKIMWNYDYKFLVTDDVDLREFDADTGPVGSGGQGMAVERHFILDHFRRLFYNGRLYVDPKPERPNPEGIRYRESLHPILEPFDLKGVGATSIRYVEPTKQDDSWLYLPSLRRVRRLSTAQRSDALFGQDTDVDSYYGYSGHIAWMDWKLLGEKSLLSCMHAEHYPVKWGDGAADFVIDDVWEKRQVYVIEGVSKLPQYAYSKRVIFIDKEAWVVPYSDIYDRPGQLWKIWINQFSFRKSPFAGAKLSNYEDEMGFLPSIVMVDVQLQHATRAALPSQKVAGSEGWFFNLGEKAGVTEDWFQIAHLIESGH